MRTVQAEQTDFAFVIAKQDQFFPEHFYRERNIAQLVGSANHQPMAAQPFPSRRAAPDMGQIADGDFFRLLH